MANDILLDDNGDLIFRNGDFVIGDSFEQEVRLIIGLNKGGLKSDPVLGCELVRMINSQASQIAIQQKIKLNLERDNKKVGSVKIENGIVKIEPNE
jgi:hypothetical protein